MTKNFLPKTTGTIDQIRRFISKFVPLNMPSDTFALPSSASLVTVITGHSEISSISILTAATDAAVKYLNQRISKIIILGWGEGNLGPSEKADFGSAGIRDGTSKYD